MSEEAAVGTENVEVPAEEVVGKYDAIPKADLKNALASMNSYLEERQESKVAYVGVTKATAVENLLKAITDVIEENEAETLPDDVILFFNTYLANAEPEEEAPVEEAAPKKEKKAKKEKAPKEPKVKKEKVPKVKKVKEPKPPKEPKGPGAVQFIIDTYVDDGITDAKGIIEHIQAKHGITVSKSTISNCACVLGHLKGRIKY